MNVKNDISEELRSLSALVATISRETPYRAPEGYFLSFPMVVLERVQPDLIKTAREVIKTARELPDIAGLEGDKPLTFTVPEGYFEGFAQQMLNRIKTGSGLAGIDSASSGMDFASSGIDSASSARMGEDEALPAILVQAGRGTPYTVQEGYFDGLSPILAVLKDKNPYLVPTGYFDRLATGIVAEVNTGRTAKPVADHSKARVISFGKRINWMKYAVAAVVTGLIVTVGWLRWHTATTGTQLAVVPPAQIDVAKNLSKVSDRELQSFLVEQDTTLAQPIADNASMATVGMDDNDIKSLLGDVPDGELKQYMEEHGGVNDIATN